MFFTDEFPHLRTHTLVRNLCFHSFLTLYASTSLFFGSHVNLRQYFITSHTPRWSNNFSSILKISSICIWYHGFDFFQFDSITHFVSSFRSLMSLSAYTLSLHFFFFLSRSVAWHISNDLSVQQRTLRCGCRHHLLYVSSVTKIIHSMTLNHVFGLRFFCLHWLNLFVTILLALWSTFNQSSRVCSFLCCMVRTI